MSKRTRIVLFALAFLFLLAGAILHYKDYSIAWLFFGIAVILYLIVRIWIQKNRRRKDDSSP